MKMSVMCIVLVQSTQCFISTVSVCGIEVIDLAQIAPLGALLDCVLNLFTSKFPPEAR